jgi:hypothetical protein
MTRKLVSNSKLEPSYVPAWRHAPILAAVALSNAFSQVANWARLGDTLPIWQPLLWEFSSVAMIGALIPAMLWLVRRFPIGRATWRHAIPSHLAATVPFSIIHVAGMVGLRKLVYATVGDSYHFGPLLANWVYEYRKDLVTYAIIIAFLNISRAWRRERELRLAKAAPKSVTRAAPDLASGTIDRLMVRKLNREFILDVTDIARLESDGNYVVVHANATTYRLRSTLTALSKGLDERRFVRIHRGQIVNVDHVREIQPWGHGDCRALLDDGNFVNLSRRYRARLDQLFNPLAQGPHEGAVRP